MSISAARMLHTHRLQPKPPRAQAITPLPPTRRLGPTAGRHTIKRSPGGIPGKNDLDRAVTTPLTSSARASNCLPAGGRRHWATREHARSASPFPGYRKRDRGRHQLAYVETETSPRIHHAGLARSRLRRKAHDADLRESQEDGSASGLEDRSLYPSQSVTRTSVTGSELGKRVAGPRFEPG